VPPSPAALLLGVIYDSQPAKLHRPPPQTGGISYILIVISSKTTFFVKKTFPFWVVSLQSFRCQRCPQPSGLGFSKISKAFKKGQRHDIRMD
jgi:hypothetical protein